MCYFGCAVTLIIDVATEVLPLGVHTQSRISCLCCGQLFVVLHNTLSTATFEAPSRVQCLWQLLHKFLMCQICCLFAATWLACTVTQEQQSVRWKAGKMTWAPVYRSLRIKRSWPSGPQNNCLCNWLTFCEVFLATTGHHINICSQSNCCYERSGLQTVVFCDFVFKWWLTIQDSPPQVQLLRCSE